jgi:DNA ligase-1
VKKGLAEFRSRKGLVFVTLQKLERIINNFKLREDVVFDGELCIIDEHGKEDFKQAVSEIRKKSGTIQNPRYIVWDMLTLEEFESKKGSRVYSERIEHMREFLSNKQYDPVMAITHQIPLESEEHLDKLRSTAISRKWEGLILRKDCGYEGKRSNNMLKVKEFIDAEYKVLDIKTSNQRFVVEGKDTEIEVLASVSICHNGKMVDVGSGFSEKEKIHFKKHPEDIIGKVITVTYMEETEDGSLRFPTFKMLHGEEREV